MGEKNTTLYKLRWVLLSIFIIGTGCMAYFLETRAFLRWLVILGVAIPVSCIAYSFAEAFTSTRWKKYVVVIAVLFGGLFWYHMSHRPTKVVRMKENVLYIKPQTDVQEP